MNNYVIIKNYVIIIVIITVSNASFFSIPVGPVTLRIWFFKMADIGVEMKKLV
jgi:hypothetical protein